MSDAEDAWGVEGIGVHGDVSAELLSRVTGADGWLLQLSGPGWQFGITIDAPSAVSTAADFIDSVADQEEFAEHRLGLFQSADVVLVKDSEFADRFWLRARGAGQMIEVAVQGHATVALQRAMRQLAEDLSE